MWEVTNPLKVDIERPLIYFIKITSPKNEYCYVGKSSIPGRLISAYHRNVERIFLGETKRPRIKQNGEPQSKGNLRYRWVHLALALAVENGWKIEHYPLVNSDKESLRQNEIVWIEKMGCNLNDGPQWDIEDFTRLKSEFD